ncbi:unnamed protein product [Diplocarpon coronariae]
MFSSMPYENPLGTSYNSTHSTDSSFSDGSSAGWDSATVSSHVYTPASTPRRGSPRSVKREGPAYAAPTPASTPDRYGSINGFCAMNALTQDMMSAYPTSMIYEDSPPATTSSTHPHPHHNPVTMASLHHYGSYLDASMCSSFVPSHGLAMGTPALDHELYSPISDMGAPTPMPESCVAPSQTVQAPFMDSFGVQSPVKSLQFTINYDLPGPDYDPGLSIDSSAPPQSMRCVASEQYHNPTPPPHQTSRGVHPTQEPPLPGVALGVGCLVAIPIPVVPAESPAGEGKPARPETREAGAPRGGLPARRHDPRAVRHGGLQPPGLQGQVPAQGAPQAAHQHGPQDHQDGAVRVLRQGVRAQRQPEGAHPAARPAEQEQAHPLLPRCAAAVVRDVQEAPEGGRREEDQGGGRAAGRAVSCSRLLITCLG